MEELRLVVRIRIHSGQLEAFKEVAKKCLLRVREKDKGTLQYDWYFNKDYTECVVLERYKDSDAVLQHTANLGEALEELLSVSDYSIEVYGTPSAELLKAAESMDVSVYSYFLGTSSP